MSLIERKFFRLNSKVLFLKSLLENAEIPKPILEGIQRALHQVGEEITEKMTLYTLAKDLPMKGWALRWIANGLSILNARIFRLNAAYIFLKTHAYQRLDPDLKSYNPTIDQYTEELCSLSMLNRNETIPIISNAYSCLPLSEIPFYPVFIPIHDLVFPNYWGILAHEFGHIYYDLRQDMARRKLLPQIHKIVKEGVSKLVSDVEAYTSSRDASFIWVRRWAPEYFADCFATKILGPAYILLSTVELSIKEPEGEVFPPSHPPARTRISLCLETLRSLKLEGAQQYVNTLEAQFKEAVSLPRVETEKSRRVEIFTHPSILCRCFEIIEETVDISPVCKLWPEILEALEKLKKFRKIERGFPLVPQICAATLLGESYPLV